MKLVEAHGDESYGWPSWIRSDDWPSTASDSGVVEKQAGEIHAIWNELMLDVRNAYDRASSRITELARIQSREGQALVTPNDYNFSEFQEHPTDFFDEE